MAFKNIEPPGGSDVVIIGSGADDFSFHKVQHNGQEIKYGDSIMENLRSACCTGKISIYYLELLIKRYV
jgi:Ca2+-binding RTX toxin-like protein